LTWQPTTNLNIGLKATIAYFRKELEENGLATRRRKSIFANAALYPGKQTIQFAQGPRAEAMHKLSPKQGQSLT